MAFLHCHTCQWTQDDFWDPEGYNPFRQDIVDYMKKQLFQDKVYMDEHVFIDLGAKFRDVHRDGDGKVWMNGADVVAIELERMAERIRRMKVRTNDEWLRVKDAFKCPGCGAKNWDID